MFKNYFKIAVRNLRKHKAYSLINLLGLAVGLAACTLIILYLHDELTFDQFHLRNDQIYRIVETQSSPDLGMRKFGLTAAPVGPALVEEIPEVENAARLIDFGRMTVQRNETRFYEEFIGVDENLFEILDFETVYGNDPAIGMAEPFTAVITQTTAEKYFGDENPVGHELETDREINFKIVAVLKDPPKNSHLQFNMLVSLQTIKANERFAPFLERWDVIGFQTYVELQKGTDPSAVEVKFPAIIDKHLTEEQKQQEQRELSLQALSDIHFYSSDFVNERNSFKNDIAYVYVFSAIAFFIIVIAST